MSMQEPPLKVKLGELPEACFSGNHLRRQQNQNAAAVRRESFEAEPKNLFIPNRKYIVSERTASTFPANSDNAR
jgi:hypothetical protein